MTYLFFLAIITRSVMATFVFSAIITRSVMATFVFLGNHHAERDGYIWQLATLRWRKLFLTGS